jgi:hypothetical protein
VPVGILELDGRLFVQASYGDGGWVQNLWMAGKATLTEHDHDMCVKAVELPHDVATAILRRTLEP